MYRTLAPSPAAKRDALNLGSIRRDWEPGSSLPGLSLPAVRPSVGSASGSRTDGRTDGHRGAPEPPLAVACTTVQLWLCLCSLTRPRVCFTNVPAHGLSGSGVFLVACQAAPQLLSGPSQPTAASVSSQTLALWKAWPITAAGTRCTGQATRRLPSPATPWTRRAREPSRGRPSSPCPETTIQGPLCWMSARSELLGPRGGEREWERRAPLFLAVWPPRDAPSR